MVTGGGQGIGRAIAVDLCGVGVDVAVIARTLADVERVAEEAAGAGGRVLPIRADVSVQTQIHEAINHAAREFGRLDFLVAAAGIYGPIGTVAANDPDAWEETIRINLLGTFFAIRAALPFMTARRYGKIVTFSGGGAVSPRPRFSAYATSKAAVVRLTETVAAECEEHHIDVNAVAPGAIATRLHDAVLRQRDGAGTDEVQKVEQLKAGAGASLERVIDLVRFLVSADSDGLTGRLISAVWDDWQSFGNRIAEIRSTDLYTVRRVVERVSR